MFVLRIYNVHNILLQIEVETDEEDNVVVLDDDNNGDNELVDMVSVGVVHKASWQATYPWPMLTRML